MRVGQIFMSLGALRPMLLHSLCQYFVNKWYSAGIRQGVEAGFVVPGVTRGIHAQALLQVRVKDGVCDLMKKEQIQRRRLEVALQKGFAGGGTLDFRDDGLTGLPE